MKKSLLLFLMVNCGSFPVLAEKLIIGTNPFYQPFEYINQDNKIVGFDIELVNTLCTKIQAECEFKSIAFDNLIPSLKTRKLDAVISGMDITEERKKQVTFVGPYYQNSASYIVSKSSNITTSSDLKQKKIGVQNGTTHQKYLFEQRPDVTITNYDSYPNALLDLNNGRIDAVMCDTAVSQEMLKDHPSLTLLTEKIVDPNYFGTGLGIAVRKQNNTLNDKLNNALTEIKNNGTYQQLYNKWFTP